MTAADTSPAGRGWYGPATGKVRYAGKDALGARVLDAAENQEDC